MATKIDTPKAPKTPKTPIAFADRVKAQLSTAALKQKITADELTMLASHIDKLKALLA